MRATFQIYRQRLKKLYHHWRKSWLQSTILWLAFSIYSSALWIHQKFGDVPFNRFLFHMQLGYNGLLVAEYYVIKSFILSCIILPGFLAAIIASGILTAVFPCAVFRWWSKSVSIMASFLCLVLSGLFFLHRVSFFKYLKTLEGYDYFSAHYKDPRQIPLVEDHPKNLVLIYVESLEEGYSHPELFGKDLLQNLDSPGKGRVIFSRYRQAPGTGWTMAALVATQCGVPLETISLYDGNFQGDKLKHFLPGAVCLGDILDREGYHNVFMEGFSLDWAGKGRFFKDHHYAERYGREEWIAQGDKYLEHSAWGMRDDDLLKHAKRELDILEASGQRFNLTLLTLDTHYPGPETLSNYCAQHGAANFEDIVKCTADQLADFVDYIRQKGYLNNLNIVIQGDHLAMSNPDITHLTKVKERHIFNLFIAQKAARKNRETILHFDLFPTILDFIGIHVQGGRLGLGYSAFSAETLPPLNRYQELQNNLLHFSPIYLNLWKNQVAYSQASASIRADRKWLCFKVNPKRST